MVQFIIFGLGLLLFCYISNFFNVKTIKGFIICAIITFFVFRIFVVPFVAFILGNLPLIIIGILIIAIFIK